MWLFFKIKIPTAVVHFSTIIRPTLNIKFSKKTTTAYAAGTVVTDRRACLTRLLNVAQNDSLLVQLSLRVRN